MFASKFARLSKRTICTSTFEFAKKEHPLSRTLRILKNDIKVMFNPPKETSNIEDLFPHHVDIAIIGGGAIGSSIAYFLKHKTGLRGVRVAVVEKDLTYSKCSTTLSVGGLRQQFSLPENIQMSLYGAQFLRSLKTRFGADAEVYYTPNGYLMLATKFGVDQLIENSKLQIELGAHNIILTKDQLSKRFPWLNVNNVEAGCLGLEKEGWFDPWAFLHILKQGASELGAQYVNGEVIGFTFTDRRDIICEGVVEGQLQGINELIVKLPNDELKSIQFAYCILAAGYESGEIAKLARIGCGPGILTVPLPVEKRKRYVYCFDCQDDGPGINTPMTIDYTGVYFRRDGLGGSFIAGVSPLPEEEKDGSDLSIDHQYFDKNVWPLLAERVPAFNKIKMRNSWGGYYGFNTYDENGIIGIHPYYHNLFIATGFSNQGIQQAPAIGRAVAELILDGNFRTIDLTRLNFDRLLVDKPMFEVCIV